VNALEGVDQVDEPVEPGGQLAAQREPKQRLARVRLAA
jgi:hypothetical protein